MNRRVFLLGTACTCAATILQEHLHAMSSWVAAAPNTAALRQAGYRADKILACYTGAHQLLAEPIASSMIADTFSMIAAGNDLKFSNRLRPAPDVFDFQAGDADIAWSEQHKLLFRGHCLVWWNALPNWFDSYVNAGNARQVMIDHITKTVEHYAGRVFSWDVVNEAIYHDNRPDGLRRKPWLDFIGPDYIDIAFHTAHAADPKAKLVLNECYIEHDTPAEKSRRESLLALATGLRRSGVPITHIGVQGHLRGNTPLDKPGMTEFCKRLRGAGLEIMITELDVDTINVPADQQQQVVAAKYGEFLDLVGPYVKIITFEALRDDPAYPRNPDGGILCRNLFGVDYQPGRVYDSVVDSLKRLATHSVADFQE
jgi:endo-1,4-beta-xylanase